MRSILTLSLVSLCAGGSISAQRAQTTQQVAYPALLGADLTNRFPYSMSGQLYFSSGDADFQGSGTVIFRRSVLTAAHNLWSADEGWSYGAEFNRARSGRTIAKTAVVSRMFVLGGYQTFAGRYGSDSIRTFAYDLGGVRLATPPADGSYAGWKSDLSLLQGSAYNICLGYGAETHSGNDLLYVEPANGFRSASGAFLENTSLTFEAGMSGGPVFAEAADGSLRIVAIVVAGGDDPPVGGIRAIDPTAARFMNTFLRY